MRSGRLLDPGRARRPRGHDRRRRPGRLIDFKSLHYDVNETDGQATVTVERLGGVGGAVSVDYETSDGSATAGSDYAATQRHPQLGGR